MSSSEVSEGEETVDAVQEPGSPAKRLDADAEEQFAAAMLSILRSDEPERDTGAQKRKRQQEDQEERRAAKDSKKKKSETEKVATTVKLTPVFDHKERSYRQIATKGVIMLFNAIRKSHSTAQESSGKASGPEVQSLPKATFLDMLKRSSQNPENESAGASGDEAPSDARAQKRGPERREKMRF